MNNENPYASPHSNREPADGEPTAASAELVEETVAWPWRWGAFLILPDTAALPQLCARCGQSTDRPLQPRTLRWINPLFFIMLVISPPLFVLVSLIGQRKGTLFVTLCEAHEQRQCKFNRAFWALLIAALGQGVLSIVLMVTLDRQWPLVLLLSSFFTLLASAVVHNIGARVVSVEKIEKRTIWLKNLPAAFFAGVPTLRSANGRTPIIPDFD